MSNHFTLAHFFIVTVSAPSSVFWQKVQDVWTTSARVSLTSGINAVTTRMYDSLSAGIARIIGEDGSKVRTLSVLGGISNIAGRV